MSEQYFELSGCGRFIKGKRTECIRASIVKYVWVHEKILIIETNQRIVTYVWVHEKILIIETNQRNVDGVKFTFIDSTTAQLGYDDFLLALEMSEMTTPDLAYLDDDGRVHRI